MHLKIKFILAAFALALSSAGQLHADSFSGKLVKAIDGNTVEVLRDGKEQRVRLAQIYAPVKDQPFGMVARNFLWRAANQIVTVRFDHYDLYGRPVGEVFLPDGTNLNKLIVRAGYAWRYDGYSDDPEYADLEAGARQAGLGLWEVDNPVPPWEWQWVQKRAASLRASGGSSDPVCGSKHHCYQMESCEEAKFYLYACGLKRLDRDGDRTPCKPLCK